VSALDAALARKGLTKIDGDSTADLLIGYQTTEQIDEKFAGYGGWSTGPGWHATGGGSDQAWMIYHGVLAVAMYDAAKHELVWKGTASKALDPKANPEKRQKNLNKAVTKLMNNYPQHNCNVR
jgi:hypothetical protein